MEFQLPITILCIFTSLNRIAYNLNKNLFTLPSLIEE